MPIPLIVPLIGALGFAAYWAKKTRDDSALAGAVHGDFEGTGMTPERQAVYEVALNQAKDPAKIEALAATFAAEGLTAQAVILQKRAELRRLPPEVKAARKEAFRKALSSSNKAAILDLAREYQIQGCGGAARKLYEYAQGLP